MIRKTVISLVLAAGLMASAMTHAAGSETTRVPLAYIGNPQHAALLGVRQGLDEANLQGRFLGQDYQLELIDPAAAPGTDFSKFVAVMAAVDAETLLKLAVAANRRALFNLTAEEDSLRADCVQNLLHVIPSNGMKRAAVAQWHSVHPDAQATATAWHGDFMKFAGRDLNKRFQKAHDRPMDEHAWAGWAAVKMTSDSIARGEASTAAALLGFLKSRLSFDGQKGVDMNFRPTGQLRQTLLITEGGKLAGEAPVRGVAAVDDLDSLDTIVCAR